jgi:hypothetical protein
MRWYRGYDGDDGGGSGVLMVGFSISDDLESNGEHFAVRCRIIDDVSTS